MKTIMVFSNQEKFEVKGLREKDITTLNTNPGLKIEKMGIGGKNEETIINVVANVPEEEEELDFDDLVNDTTESTNRIDKNAKYRDIVTNEEFIQGNMIDFIIVDKYVFYVKNIKMINTKLTGKSDLKRINIRFDNKVIILDETQIAISLDRFTEGSKANYMRFFERSEQLTGNEFINIKDCRKKSFTNFITIPESALRSKVITNHIDNCLKIIQDLSLFIGLKAEEEFRSNPKYKEATLMIRSKDYIRELLQLFNNDETMDKKDQIKAYKQDIQKIFAGLGIAPLSSLRMDNSFVVTKMSQTTEEDDSYDSRDDINQTNRSFVKNYARRYPIVAGVLSENGDKLNEVKAYVMDQMIAITYKALKQSYTTSVPAPILENSEYNVAGIDQNDLDEFLNNTLPNLVKEYSENEINLKAKRGVANLGKELII